MVANAEDSAGLRRVTDLNDESCFGYGTMHELRLRSSLNGIAEYASFVKGTVCPYFPKQTGAVLP